MIAPTGRHTRAGRVVGDGWAALSTIISGIVVWGAIGLGLDRLFGATPIFFVICIILGIHLGAYLVYVNARANEEMTDAS